MAMERESAADRLAATNNIPRPVNLGQRLSPFLCMALDCGTESGPAADRREEIQE